MIYYTLLSGEKNEDTVSERIYARQNRRHTMSQRIHLQKVHKHTNLSDTIPDYDGTCYDYTDTVKYYGDDYFRGNMSCDFEQWLEEYLHPDSEDIMWSIPEYHLDRPWEIGKQGFRNLERLPEIKENAIQGAIEMGLADDREDVERFIKDALASDTDGDIVYIELW